jgi:hypothetical protein
MLSIIKRIGGILLVIWAFIRPIVDLLESLKATRHYAEFLYLHAASIISLSPRPSLLMVGILLVGTGLIFSDSVQRFITKYVAARKPNIICNRISIGAIDWNEKLGYFEQKANPPDSHIAYLMEIANEALPDRKAISAGRIKAQLIFRLNNDEFRCSPGSWVNEPLSAVELGAGDTRWLILAVGIRFVDQWSTIANRRSTMSDPIARHYNNDLPGVLGSAGTVQVDLIGVETEQIIATL